MPKLSPTLLNSRMTPAPLSAEVLVDLGRSPSASRNSLKSESTRKLGCLAVLFKYLFQVLVLICTCTCEKSIKRATYYFFPIVRYTGGNYAMKRYLSNDALLFSTNSCDPDSSLDIFIFVIPKIIRFYMVPSSYINTTGNTGHIFTKSCYS